MRALGNWCRWLSSYLYQIPGTDLYTMNPTLGTGAVPYRDVAGNQFAAAAAGYWLKRAQPDEEVARPLRGLIRLALGTHVSVNAIDRPDIQKWGATLSFADDWNGDLLAAVHGMLLSDALPSDQHEQLLKILAWEADKRVEYGISKKFGSWPGLYPAPSVAESNAWSTTILQAARLAMPSAPQQFAWRKAAIEYSLNAISLPRDLISEEVIGGRPLKDAVRGANFQPGGIQEHHGFFHPGYECWALAYQAFSFVLDRQLPTDQRDPDVYLHNWMYVFDRLKQSTFSDGRLIQLAGDDWLAYGYGNTQLMTAALFGAAAFHDPDAARLADEWLALIDLRQRATGGSVHGATLGSYQRFRLTDFSWYEGQEGCSLAQALWLLDRLDESAIPPPSTEQDFDARNVGTFYDPNALLAWYRDDRHFASISWRAAFRQWQAIVQPVALPHLYKFNHNGTGLVDITGADKSINVESSAIGTFDEGGFWSLGRIGRDTKLVTVMNRNRKNNSVSPLYLQYQALIALPEGPTLLVDLCRANDQIWLLRESGLGLRLAADVFNEYGVRIATEEGEKVWSLHPSQDTWHDLKTRSVTLEKLLTIHALEGEGSFQLLQKRQRHADQSELSYSLDMSGAEESLLSHELYFGPSAYQRPRIVSPGEWFRKTVLVMYCDPSKTPVKPAGVVTGEFPCLAVYLPDINSTIIVNFADREQSVQSPGGLVTVLPLSVKIMRQAFRPVTQ